MGPSSQDIRADIEHTRERLTEDVDELAERASPRGMAQRRTERIREAVFGMRDKVKSNGHGDGHAARERARRAVEQAREQGGHTRERLGETAGQAGSAVREAPHRATERTQGAPLAAGLIAFGAGMLLASLLPSSRREQQAAERLTELAEPATEAARESVERLKADERQSAQDAVQRIKAAATDAALSAGKHAGQQAKEQAQQLRGQ